MPRHSSLNCTALPLPIYFSSLSHTIISKTHTAHPPRQLRISQPLVNILYHFDSLNIFDSPSLHPTPPPPLLGSPAHPLLSLALSYAGGGSAQSDGGSQEISTVRLMLSHSCNSRLNDWKCKLFLVSVIAVHHAFSVANTVLELQLFDTIEEDALLCTALHYTALY